jgi:hypothetical protein
MEMSAEPLPGDRPIHNIARGIALPKFVFHATPSSDSASTAALLAKTG